MKKVAKKAAKKKARVSDKEQYLNLLDLRLVRDEPIEWFWFDKIPAGVISMLIGNAGSGKTFMSVYMAALVSRGSTWPDGFESKKGSVLILNCEDQPARLKERLKCNNADISMIKIIQSANCKEEYINIPKHIAAISNTLQNMPDCKLLIIDPITDYLGTVNANSNSEVREALGLLSAVTSKLNITVLLANHLNKKIDTDHIHRGLGSTAFTALSRSVWGLVRHGTGKDAIYTFAPVKTNYSINPTGHTFKIVDAVVKIDAEPYIGDMDNREADRQYKRLDEAVAWLREELAAGRMLSDTVISEAKAAGYSRVLLTKAKSKIGIIAKKVGFGKDAPWYWVLKDV